MSDASSPDALQASNSAQVYCRQVFPESEYEQCGSGAEHGYSPQDLESAYRLPSETGGSGQTVAIVDAYDDPHAQADLDVYRSTYDLPPCDGGCFSKINQVGGTTYPEANPGWAIEISLDLDMVSAACPKCHILLVEANDESEEDLGIAENEAASPAFGTTEISNSYAFREKTMGEAKVEKYSAYYKHEGIPITVASGDKGYDNEKGGTKNGKGECTNCSPSFPADLNTVIAVGGTRLEPEGTTGRGWGEGVWSLSGSGCTQYVTKPLWQKELVKSCGHRIDNDVAAVAALETPVSVYDTYEIAPAGWQNIGGTSVAAPLTAGAIALEETPLRGEGVEGIYKHAGNWYDVTSEHNWVSQECSETSLCTGELGYDGPTGIGTPNDRSTATPPSAWTEPASAVTTSAGSLNGIVNPEASAETTYYFQYGSSSYYGRTVPAGGAKVTGYTDPSRVSQTLAGLRASTRYHFRVVAKNAGGTTYGADQAFSTPPAINFAPIGSKGSAEGQLDEPQFTAVNGEGDVWVTDYVNNRVEEFSQGGTFMRACGKSGSGEVQFNGPTGIAVNPDGLLYISDSRNGRIEVISQQCAYRASFGKPYLSDPMGLTFSAGGPTVRALLLVANAGDNDIAEFNWAATEPPLEISYGSTGSGEGQFSDPTDIILGAKESATTQAFYVVDSGNNRVQEFSESGFYTFGGEERLTFRFDEAFGSKGSAEGSFSSPKAVVLDPSSGDLDVSDSGNNRIEQFLPSGAYVSKFGSAGSGSSSLAGPGGIAVTAAGRLYIADTLNNRIVVWGPSEAGNPEWVASATPNPARTLSSYLWGVSCVAQSTSCAAVGQFSVESGGTSEPMAEWWNGTEWTLQSTASPSKYSALYGVSCISSTSCSGVGIYKNSAGVYASLVESWNGAKWGIQTVPQPSGATSGELDAVSCTSASACTAVGEYENGSGSLLPFALRWNGSEWKVQSMPNPTGAKTTFATGVSCVSSSACTMVGTYENSASAYLPYAESWNGTEWKFQSMPTPTGATATRMHGGVSCSSSSACTGSGYYINSSGVEVTLAERWNGTEWKVQATPNPGETKVNSFSGVSCASSTICTAVGASQNSSGKWVTLAEQWNGSEWKLIPTPNGEKGEGWLTGGVSCAAAPVPCVAVGNAGEGLAELYG